MSRKFKRNEIPDLEPVQVTETTGKAQIPFSHWFERQVKKGAIRSYQEEALLVFFKKQGLKNIEDENSYNKAFEKF